MMGKAVAWSRLALAKNQDTCAVAQIMPLTMPGKVASPKMAGVFLVSAQYSPKYSVEASQMPTKWEKT